MAYDAQLAARVRQVVGPRGDVSEKKMFGGVAFLLDGKMFCGVSNDDLMVRVGPEHHQAALARAHVRPIDFSGRPMTGYVFDGNAGSLTENHVKRRTDQATAFVATLESKGKKRRT
jgi:hypothetical protein